MLTLVREFIECESGSSAVEYAVLVSMVALGIVGVLTSMGTSMTDSLGSLSASMATIDWT